MLFLCFISMATFLTKLKTVCVRTRACMYTCLFCCEGWLQFNFKFCNINFRERGAGDGNKGEPFVVYALVQYSAQSVGRDLSSCLSLSSSFIQEAAQKDNMKLMLRLFSKISGNNKLIFIGHLYMPDMAFLKPFSCFGPCTHFLSL